MKKRIGFTLCGSLLCCIGLLLFGCAQQKEPSTHGFGMFSWHAEIMTDEKALADCIEQADVTTVYHQFSEDSLLNGDASAFITSLRNRNVDTYALMGDAEWAYETDGASLIAKIEEIAAYNEKQHENARISGVMVDVEPYLLDEWGEKGEVREKLMADYLSCMQAAYACARENQLQFLACIPMFYDSTNADVLENLIAYACDGIAVMNYNRTDEYGQIAKEVGLSREYGKKIICIYELQKAGKHDLEEINTYAGQGLESLWQSAEQLEQQFGYEGLQFAYHYYGPLQDLLEQEQSDSPD